MFEAGELNAKRGEGRGVLDSLLAISKSHKDPRGGREVLGLAAQINQAGGSPPAIRGDEWVEAYRAFDKDGATRLLILGIMRRHPSRSEALSATAQMAVISQGVERDFTFAMDHLIGYGEDGVAELLRLQRSDLITNPRARRNLEGRLRSIPRTP
jgi:hypothetical protein